MEWDLSPVRPWEWAEMDVGEWYRAKETQQAFKDGIAEAHESVAASKEMEQKVTEMKRQRTG